MTAAPDPGTCAAELVEIGELLICFAQSNSEARVEIRTKLMRKSNALAERLKVTDGAILQPVTHRQSPRALARAERAQVRKFLTDVPAQT